MLFILEVPINSIISYYSSASNNDDQDLLVNYCDFIVFTARLD